MGKTDLPKKYLESNVGYKYVALEKDRDIIVFWEILYTASSSIDAERNRLLDIETSILKSSKSWFCQYFYKNLSGLSIISNLPKSIESVVW